MKLLGDYVVVPATVRPSACLHITSFPSIGRAGSTRPAHTTVCRPIGIPHAVCAGATELDSPRIYEERNLVANVPPQ